MSWPECDFEIARSIAVTVVGSAEESLAGLRSPALATVAVLVIDGAAAAGFCLDVIDRLERPLPTP